jgi:hypothetical protein
MSAVGSFSGSSTLMARAGLMNYAKRSMLMRGAAQQ